MSFCVPSKTMHKVVSAFLVQRLYHQTPGTQDEPQGRLHRGHISSEQGSVLFLLGVSGGSVWLVRTAGPGPQGPSRWGPSGYSAGSDSEQRGRCDSVCARFDFLGAHPSSFGLKGNQKNRHHFGGVFLSWVRVFFPSRGLPLAYLKPTAKGHLNLAFAWLV